MSTPTGIAPRSVGSQPPEESATKMSIPRTPLAAEPESGDLPALMARFGTWLRLQGPLPKDVTADQRLSCAPEDVRNAYERASRILAGLKEGDKDPWLSVTIRTIVRKSTRYIVFLDEDLDVQWWWLTMPQQDVVAIVQSHITQLSHESAFLTARNAKLAGEGSGGDDCKGHSIRLCMAEAMALALNGGSEEECNRVLAAARRNIVVAKDQICRPAFTFYFFWSVFLLGVVTLATLFIPKDVVPIIGEHVPKWLGAATAGAFGALLSALSRTSQLGLEPASGNRGHRIEALSRLLLGAGAAVLLRLAWHGGLLSGALGDGSAHGRAWLAFLCIAAGASERILPALVSRAEAVVSGAVSSPQKA